MVTIRVRVETGFTNCRHEGSYEIDDAEWDAKTPEEQEAFLNEMARDELSNQIEAYAEVVRRSHGDTEDAG